MHWPFLMISLVQMEGEGVYRFLGSEYKGSFQGGKRHGDGTMVFITGDKYTGKWSADMPSTLVIAPTPPSRAPQQQFNQLAHLILCVASQMILREPILRVPHTLLAHTLTHRSWQMALAPWSTPMATSTLGNGRTERSMVGYVARRGLTVCLPSCASLTHEMVTSTGRAETHQRRCV